MPLPVIASIARCAMHWNVGELAQTAINVIHVATELEDEADIAAAINDVWAANLDAFLAMTSTAQLVAISVTKLDGTSATQDISVDGVQGAQSGQFIPASAGVVKLTTAVRGRSHRGRIYLPFISEAAQQDGRVVGDAATDPQAAWEAIVAAMAASDVELSVASYLLESADPVTNVLWETVLGTQRRRQTRVRTSS